MPVKHSKYPIQITYDLTSYCNATFDKIAISSIVIGTLFHEIGHSVEADVNTRDIKPLSPNINVYEKNDKRELFGYMPFSTEGFSRIEFPIIKNGIIVNKIGSLCFSNGNITNGFSLHGSIPIPRTTSMIITTDTMYDTDYDATIVYAESTVNIRPTAGFGFCKKNNEYIHSSQFADFSLVIRKSDFKKCLYS
jgi:predicted Zn-dependent protease